MKIINRSNILDHLVEKQLNIIERTVFDALFEKNWREKWFLTSIQSMKFKKYSIPLIRRIFKCNRKRAEVTYEWFIDQYGLSVKD